MAPSADVVSHLELGRFDQLDRYELAHPLLKRPAKGKVFLAGKLGLTGMEVSVNKLPAGKGVPFLHAHKTHEELYLFVKGRGQIQVDGRVLPVQEGTCVRVSPQGARALRNDSDQDLYFLCIQAREGSLGGVAAIDDGVPVPGPVEWPA